MLMGMLCKADLLICTLPCKVMMGNQVMISM